MEKTKRWIKAAGIRAIKTLSEEVKNKINRLHKSCSHKFEIPTYRQEN